MRAWTTARGKSVVTAIVPGTFLAAAPANGSGVPDGFAFQNVRRPGDKRQSGCDEMKQDDGSGDDNINNDVHQQRQATFRLDSRTVGGSVEMKPEVEIEPPRMHSNDVKVFPRRLIAFWLSSSAAALESVVI